MWKSYSEVHNLAVTVGSNLLTLGLKPHDPESLIGIYSKNRWEYDVVQLACGAFAMIPVPIYDTLGKEGCSSTAT